MKSHPIVFSAPDVRALLERRKTVDRRLDKQWLKVKAGDELWVRETWCPVNDSDFGGGQYVEYRATPRPGFSASHPAGWEHAPDDAEALKWKPSIHMPRWASRITLRATEDARLERLQDITEEEAIAEGCESWNMSEEDVADIQISDDSPDLKELARLLGPGTFLAKGDYRMLWDSLHGKTHPWESNPEVVRIAFEMAEAK